MHVLRAIVTFSIILAVSSVAEAAPEPDKTNVAGPKMICKERRKTGTRFTTKICRTAAQWEQIAEGSRASLKELVDRPQIKACGPGGCD